MNTLGLNLTVAAAPAFDKRTKTMREVVNKMKMASGLPFTLNEEKSPYAGDSEPAMSKQGTVLFKEDEKKKISK